MLCKACLCFLVHPLSILEDVSDSDDRSAHSGNGGVQMMQEETRRIAERMMSAKFDFTDMLKQTEMIARFGSMSAFLKLMPGMNK
jgi:hypothetical protein